METSRDGGEAGRGKGLAGAGRPVRGLRRGPRRVWEGGPASAQGPLKAKRAAGSHPRSRGQAPHHSAASVRGATHMSHSGSRTGWRVLDSLAPPDSHRQPKKAAPSLSPQPLSRFVGCRGATPNTRPKLHLPEEAPQPRPLTPPISLPLPPSSAPASCQHPTVASLATRPVLPTWPHPGATFPSPWPQGKGSIIRQCF